MSLDLSLGEGSLSIFPDADKEVRLIFTWLNFVRYKDRNRSADSGLGSTQLLSAQMRRPIQPAEKVKCVVWDLDNTLWEGILVEDGPDGVTLRSEASALLKALDERGIVQSIASKNDHDAAWSVIVALGLSEYFIYPSIHWGPKSESLIAIANAFNFNLDSVALIDDSAVERAEVSSKLSQVRVYRESDIPDLGARKEFNVPITSASKLRRQSYLAEAKRKNVALSFDSDNIDFLMNCKLEFELFVPTDEEEWNRCHELLRRTNQLNLSNRDYDEEAFRSIIRDTTITKIGGRCKDRFGDYGIIGFWILSFKEEEARLIDFVQSCRVANKKLENAFFVWILKMLRQQNYSELKVTFIPTERNHILLDILYDVGFEKIGEAENGIDLRLSISARPEHCDVVQLRDNVSPLAPAMAVTT